MKKIVYGVFAVFSDNSLSLIMKKSIINNLDSCAFFDLSELVEFNRESLYLLSQLTNHLRRLILIHHNLNSKNK